MIPYAFHPEAEAELTEAALFYESRVVGLGSSFLHAVERTVSLVRRYPGLGTQADHDALRVLVPRFPYAVVYRREPGSVLVLAIAHVRRRPAYWRARAYITERLARN